MARAGVFPPWGGGGPGGGAGGGGRGGTPSLFPGIVNEAPALVEVAAVAGEAGAADVAVATAAAAGAAEFAKDEAVVAFVLVGETGTP